MNTRQTTARELRMLRRRLFGRRHAANDYGTLRDVVVRGLVPAANLDDPDAEQDGMSFALQTADGRRVKAPLNDYHREIVVEALAGYKTGKQKVEVRGVGLFSRGGKLLAVQSVPEISLLHPLDVASRLDELRALRHGWYELDTPPLDAEGLDWLEEAFDKYYPEDLPSPYLYPTPEGDVRVEWRPEGWYITWVVNLVTKKAFWHALDTETFENTTGHGALDTTGGWADAIANVRKRLIS